MDIQFIGYRTITGTAASGISLLFNINGKEYRRVSQLETNKLLWWKREEEYLTENEVNLIEPIIRDLFRGKLKELEIKELQQA